MDDLQAAEAALTEAIRRFVRASVDAALPKADPPYTSTSLPPDCPSRRRFHEIAKQIPTAEKRGRVWVVSRADWKTFRASPKRDHGADAVADAYISAAGYRLTA